MKFEGGIALYAVHLVLLVWKCSTIDVTRELLGLEKDKGPDLTELMRKVDAEVLSANIRAECKCVII